MWKNIISEVFFNILSLQKIKDRIKKKIYPFDQFKKDIIVDTRSSNPIIFILNTDIPIVHIWLSVTNKSQYLEAIFDRAELLSLHVHGNGLRCILSHKHIMPKKTIYKKGESEIFCSFELNEKQIDILKQIDNTSRISANLSLEYHINSSLYSFSDKITLDSRPCEI